MVTDTTPLVEGYATIPRSIQRDPDISWKAKLVYLALSSRVDRHLRCWPSLETIAKESSCGVTAVKQAREELRALGLITWWPGPARGGEGRPTVVYQLGAALPSIGRETTDTPEFQSPGDLVSVATRPGTNNKNDLKEEEPSGSSKAGPDDDPRPEVIALCERLLERVKANGAVRAKIGKDWYRECRLLLDRDGVTVEQVEKAIDWATAHHFWKTNVLSMPTLRKQYDRLRLAAIEERKSTSGNRRPEPPPPAYESRPAVAPEDLPWAPAAAGR